MSDQSRIEWTDASWNPIVGCSKASPGCTHCYAERMAARLGRMGQPQYDGLTRDGRWTGETRLVDYALDQPLRWRKPRRVFVCSMGDLFHESVPDEWIDRVFVVMALCPQHTFMVLTKRPDRMRAYFESFDTPAAADRGEACAEWLLGLLGWERWCGARPNVWLGTTCEDQQRADERLPHLLATPAAVRFVSMEPLLEAVDLGAFIGTAFDGGGTNKPYTYNAGLSWIIVGGESGPGARPMHPQWARSIRDQCAAVDVPFMFKQWGEYVHPSQAPEETTWRGLDSQGDGYSDELFRVGKHRAGRLLDGVVHDGYPEASHA